jgi:hypothetical protein
VTSRWKSTCLPALALICASAAVCAQEPAVPAQSPAPPPESPPPVEAPPPGYTTQFPDAEPFPAPEWIDKTQARVETIVSRSAMKLDRMFGSDEDESVYKHAAGSIAPALLWDQFRGFQPKVRFHVDLPLPGLNERFNAFIGRVNRDEYISESAQQSGAFERQYGPASDEQTLAGISYHTPPTQGSRWDAGAGIRLRFPLDPYLKGSYVYELGKTETGLLSLRQTVFWQNSQHAGFTSRADLEKVFADKWLVRWTTSGTISERSQGVFGYSAVRALRGLPNRRAIAVEIGFDGETGADVPMHEYGIKAAWRQSVMRDWLILELRSSWTYPKDFPYQNRKGTLGVGVGFEMFFGTNEFLARPVTF